MGRISNTRKMKHFAIIIALILGFSYAQVGETLALLPDRSLYLSGEKIWFHLELKPTPGEGQQPFSKVAYLELLDLKGQAYAREKIWMENKSGQGSLPIPAELPSGHYLLKAYTLAQADQDIRPWVLRVVNPEKGLPKAEGNKEWQFYHKGGGLIMDKANSTLVEVPFQFWNKWEKIYLINHQGLKLDSLDKINPRYARLDWTPEQGQQYFLNLKQKDGEIQIFPMEIPTENLQFTLEAGSNSLNLKALFSKSSFEKLGKQEVQVDIFSRGKRLGKYSWLISGQENQLGLNSSLEPGELYYFMLKEKSGEVLSILPYQTPLISEEIEIKGLKAVYAKRSSVDFRINAEDVSLVKVVDRSLTMRRLSEQSFWFSNPDAIEASWQSGQLKDIAEPLMWIWQEHLSQNGLPRIQELDSIPFPESRGISLLGRVYARQEGQSVKNIPVLISITGESPQVHSTRTDEVGRFRLSLTGLSGVQDIFLVAKDPEGAPLSIRIVQPFRDAKSKWKAAPIFLDEALEKSIEKLYRNREVKAYFDEDSPEFRPVRHQIPFNISGEETVRKLEDFIGLPTMREVFNEVIPFVSIRSKGDKRFLYIYDNKEMLTYENPIVLLDGVPILDADHLLDADTEKIDELVVIPRRYLLGDELIGGALFVYSKEANMGGLQPEEGVVYLKYQTLSQSEKFQPLASQDEAGSSKPLFGGLLYWGEKEGSFLTGDEKGEYEVEVIRHNRPIVVKTVLVK